MKRTVRTYGARQGRGQRWLRLLALVCVLLLGGASTAQVCHSHEDASALRKGSSQNVPADHCPLCLAMHTAMPAVERTAPLPVVEVWQAPGEEQTTERARELDFSLFSRPPPVSAASSR